MTSRVIVLLFSAVLLWSGLNTIEAPRGLAQPHPEQFHAIVHADGVEAAHEGSVEHHHLDDLPWQAQSDAPVDPLGLMPPPPTDIAPPVSLAHPLLPGHLAALPPFLEGPLRPPCVVTPAA